MKIKDEKLYVEGHNIFIYLYQSVFIVSFMLLFPIHQVLYIFPSLVRWGTSQNCSNHVEILKRPVGKRPELK